MSKNIVFSNQKGGVGKTTMATLFANYLVLFEKEEVACFDFDPQESFYENYINDTQLTPDSKKLYEVEKFDLEDSGKVIELVKNYEGTAIYDLPGKLDDDNLIPLLENADAIICPFHYDKFNLDPTLTFAKVIRFLNENRGANIQLYLLPNQIDARVNYESEKKNDESKKSKTDEMLKEYGEILPAFPLKSIIKQTDVFSIPSSLNHYVSRSFDKIYKDIFSK